MAGRAPPAGLACDLVVASPLSRALATALELARGTGCRVLAHPLCAEVLENSCDIGTPLAGLKARFPAVDFSLVDAACAAVNAAPELPPLRNIVFMGMGEPARRPCHWHRAIRTP